MKRPGLRSTDARIFAFLLNMLVSTLVSTLISALIATAASAAPANKFMLVPGISGAARSDGVGRFGPEAALLYGSNVDAVMRLGLVSGLADLHSGEFYAGPAFGWFYMGSMWLEGVAHWKKGKVTSYRATAAAGIFIFLPFVSLGYDQERESPFAEGGLMVNVYPDLIFGT